MATNIFPKSFNCVDSLLRPFASAPKNKLLLDHRRKVEEGNDHWRWEGLTTDGQTACYDRLHKFLIGLSEVTGVDIDADEIVDELGHIAAGVE